MKQTSQLGAFAHNFPRGRAAELPKETLLKMYRDMLEQRRFEEAAGRAYGLGKIMGFCHLYIGQEAVSVGAAAALRPSDVMMSAYRIHAQAMARGVSAQSIMDELFGKATGCVQGLGGSMHIFDISKGFWGGWGLVGQQVPTAAGVAFAQKYQSTGDVTMVFFGDGAVHQGAIHETFNMASVWGLPIVFVVENNQYGMGTALSRVSSLEPLHEMADAYKMRHYEFNGMDLLESYDAFADAVDYAREHSRPVYLEARCSRFRGHSMSDPGKYRTKEQLEEEKSRDPIPGFAAFLVDCGVATHEALEALDETVKEEMKLVLERAEAAPWPDPELISKYVLVND